VIGGHRLPTQRRCKRGGGGASSTCRLGLWAVEAVLGDTWVSAHPPCGCSVPPTPCAAAWGPGDRAEKCDVETCDRQADVVERVACDLAPRPHAASGRRKSRATGDSPAICRNRQAISRSVLLQLRFWGFCVMRARD
jgi:hypothetical protein